MEIKVRVGSAVALGLTLMAAGDYASYRERFWPFRDYWIDQHRQSSGHHVRRAQGGGRRALC